MPQKALEFFLRRLASRNHFSGEEQRAILDLPGYPAQLKANQEFVHLGETVETACVIVEGLVGRFSQSDQGLRQILVIQIPGDIANLSTVVLPRACSALQALAKTEILIIPHRALRAVAWRYPNIAQAFWRESMVDASIIAETAVSLGRRRSVSRLAHLVAELAWRHEQGEPGDGSRFSFLATQADLADALGLTPIHVNRKVRELRQRRVATVARGFVEVHDWQALVTIGEFSPDYLHISPAPRHHRTTVEWRGHRSDAATEAPRWRQEMSSVAS